MSDKTLNLLRALFATDEDGNIYIRVVGDKVDPAKLKNAVSPTKNRSLETLLSSAIVLDDSGKPALRLAEVPFGSTKFEADKKARVQAAEDKKAEADKAQKVADKAKADKAKAEKAAAKAAKQEAEAKAKADKAAAEAKTAADKAKK